MVILLLEIEEMIVEELEKNLDHHNKMLKDKENLQHSHKVFLLQEIVMIYLMIIMVNQ